MNSCSEKYHNRRHDQRDHGRGGDHWLARVVSFSRRLVTVGDHHHQAAGGKLFERTMAHHGLASGIAFYLWSLLGTCCRTLACGQVLRRNATPPRKAAYCQIHSLNPDGPLRDPVECPWPASGCQHPVRELQAQPGASQVERN